jgi:hypothetical protein
MKRKKTGFIKRAVLLGVAALVIIIVVVAVTYPYDRVIDRLLTRVSQEHDVLIIAAEKQFHFPNKVTFYDLKVAPKTRLYRLFEASFPVLSVEMGLKALLTGRLRASFSGEIDSGDPQEGSYTVQGAASLRRGDESGSGETPQTQTVVLDNLLLTGSGVNFVVDGSVTSVGDMFDPELDLEFFVRELDRTDSANYAVHNLLAFVNGCLKEGTELPTTFRVSGPFSRLIVTRKSPEEG